MSVTEISASQFQEMVQAGANRLQVNAEYVNSLNVFLMAKRKISAGELAQKIGITNANLSILKNNKAKAIRFSTLEAICEALDCQPSDILEYVKD